MVIILELSELLNIHAKSVGLLTYVNEPTMRFTHAWSQIFTHINKN